MADYLFAYHGGSMPEDPAEVQQVHAAWGAWMESIGSSITNNGAPLGASSTVTANGVTDGGGANPVSGFTLVQADSLADAVELSKGCPILQAGGSIEVAEMISM